MEQEKNFTSEYKTDEEAMKNYQKKFDLSENELEKFKNFLIDENQKCFIRNHEQIVKVPYGYFDRLFY